MFFALRVVLVAATTFFSFVSSTKVIAQQPYRLTDSTIVHRLDSYTEIFIDTSNSFSIDQVTDPEFQNRFYRSNSNLTFGYLKSPIWLKIRTQTSTPKTKWYLEIPAPFLEYIDFYQWRNEGWSHSSAGYYRPHNIREVSHTGYVLPLEFDTNATSTVYIRITGRSPKTFPLFAIERDKFNEKVRWEDLGYGVFFGILIVMFFYNLFIYLTLKQTNYLLYICTIVCTFLIFASATGYGGKFLWPQNPTMNYYAGRLLLSVFAIFLALFALRFLEVKQYSRVMYYALLSLIPLAIVALILVATGTLPSAGNNLISLSIVMLMISGIVCRIKGNKTANYFIAAWTIYLIGGLLLTLRNSGFFDFNFWTTHFVEIGAALETIIIAFALGDRYRRLRIEKEEAQLLALKLQQEATVKLEFNVKERTEQLSKANEELQSTLETNQRQTEIIEKKNAELDAFFYRISHDLKGPISSLLGLSWLARIDVKDEVAQDYIEKQHQQIEHLNNIVTGLINLVVLSHSDLQKEKIDFNKMIDECIASFNSHENFSTITFKKDVQPGISFRAVWPLLNAILQNLIENAIKYAGKHSPYVKIRIYQETGPLTMEVEDNGQGIPKEHQAKIFEMFYRATQNANGSGLGLYILKRSLDKLNGTIDIKSDVGVGSTFTVKIPE